MWIFMTSFLLLLLNYMVQSRNQSPLNIFHDYHYYDEIPEKIVKNNSPGQTTENKFPFLVSIQIVKLHICGGSLISDKYVLTAAHCLTRKDKDDVLRRFNPIFIKVIIGEIDLNSTNIDCKHQGVEDTYIHPDFSLKNIFHDIAIIKLNTTITDVPYLKLASKAQIVDALKTNREVSCDIAGWGAVIPVKYNEKLDRDKSFSPTLQYAHIQIVSSRFCEDYYGLNLFQRINQICTYAPEVDSCMGDSGGPLICNGKLYGILSYGYGCLQNYPSVYTRVDRYGSWIEKISGVSKSICIQHFSLFTNILFLILILNI